MPPIEPERELHGMEQHQKLTKNNVTRRRTNKARIGWKLREEHQREKCVLALGLVILLWAQFMLVTGYPLGNRV